jgi:hypothetical protein
LRLAGKGAVVTGGTRGIGRATVDAFLAEGAHVVACGRSELPPDADRLSWVRADVSREDEVEALFDAALDRLPGLDVVVNNAGVAHDTLLVDLTLADWQRCARRQPCAGPSSSAAAPSTRCSPRAAAASSTSPRSPPAGWSARRPTRRPRRRCSR